MIEEYLTGQTVTVTLNEHKDYDDENDFVEFEDFCIAVDTVGILLGELAGGKLFYPWHMIRSVLLAEHPQK